MANIDTIRVSTISILDILNSTFSNNTGGNANDLYLYSFTTGTITINNTVFSGKGTDNVDDLDVYDMQPAIKIKSSTNIAFHNWLISGYVKGDLGTGFYISSSTVTITDTLIEDNNGIDLTFA